MSAPTYTKDSLSEFIKFGVASIGDHSYGTPILRYWRQGYKFFCGRYCSISDNVQIFLGGYHRPDWVSMYPFPAFPHWIDAPRIGDFAVGRGDVSVGNDVWIGSHATIMGGVNIGDGAVVGAHAVVSKDIPPYGVAVGNPARVVKFRFSAYQIDNLVAISWWNWPEDKILREIPLLLSGNVDEFIKQHNESSSISDQLVLPSARAK